MMYTPIEMAAMFRQAADKRDIMAVLMIGNGMPEAQVADILKEQGIPDAEIPRGKTTTNRGRKKKTAQPEPVPEAKPEPDEETSDARIIAAIRKLVEEKAALESQLAAINKRLGLIRLTLLEADGDE